MNMIPTAIEDVFIVEPRVFEDSRGFFFESYNKARFDAALQQDIVFVQDNHSRSAKGVLRGLHYQVRQAQGKLVRASVGEIFDVAVDIRTESPTYGRWVGVVLSATNKRQLWIPPGLAHGFYVTSDHAEVQYKATEFYSPENERSLLWSDPELAIDWPLTGEPLLSDKDASAPGLTEATKQ